jgi:hypothetical protein
MRCNSARFRATLQTKVLHVLLWTLRNREPQRDDVSVGSPKPAVPSELRQRAIADLRYIRETMSTATEFTAVSGIGYVLIGFGALATYLVAARMADPIDRLDAWLADAIVSIAVGAATTAWKARHAGQPLLTGPFRKFVTGFAPAIFGGAVLTAAVMRFQVPAILPALWLLLYGAGLVAAGAFSIPLIPVMGVAFLAIGALAAMGPAEWGETLLLCGFAGLHIVFGLVIVRRYGG